MEELGTTEKQKVKECEKQEMTEQDTELVHQEVNNDMVAGNDEPFVEILRSQDKCEEDKTYKEDTHVKKGFDYNNTENFASENDELNKEVPRENLETHDENKEEAGIDDQIFHPGEDIIERYDKNQKEKLDTQDTNEPFQIMTKFRLNRK